MDITQHSTTEIRLNKLGQPELVRKRKGKRPEGTLSELADDISHLLEYMEFGGPMPAMSPEQPPNDRALNQSPELVASRGDQIRNHDETITNMGGSTPMAADSPELSRVKSRLQATATGNKVRNKYIAGSTGVGIDYSAPRTESFTGTSGIAIAPTQYNVIGDDDDEEESNQASESNMKRTIDDLLLEWEPEFKGGEYSPGDYQMVSPSGDGVVKRKPKQDRTGAFDTDTTEAGKPFPGKHKVTAAMCDVDEDGVENKPQGGHESSVGEPTDGHQSKMGHDWPKKAKHSGGGVAEPFSGTRWSDGGTLESGSGSDDNNYSKGSPGSPKGGPRMGEPMEWSPEKIGQLLGEEADLQNLFDSYARTSPQVHVEGFQELCDAHGLGVMLDESSLLGLMAANQEFMFHEYGDSNGTYWLAEEAEETHRNIDWDCEFFHGDNEEALLAATLNDIQLEELPSFIRTLNDFLDSPGYVTGSYPEEWKIDNIKLDGSDDAIIHLRNGDTFDISSETSFLDIIKLLAPPITEGVISELQIRSPEEEASLFKGRYPTGDPHHDDDYNARLKAGRDPMDRFGSGPMGAADEYGDDEFGDDEYGDDEYGDDEFGEMMHGEEDIPQEEAPYFEGREIVTGPQMNESLGKFMTSARSLIENSKGVNRRDIANALNRSWEFHAGNINAATTPTKVQGTLRQMMESFPGFNPLLNEAGKDAMESASGKAITADGMKQSPHLNKQPGPDEMEQHGSKDNPLKRDQKNTYTSTPIMKGTEKGLTGTGKVKEESKLSGPNAAILRDNVNKLAKKIRESIRESAKGLRGKHTVNFSIVVAEGNAKTRTPTRSQLVEAVADLEEVLQFHPLDDVTFETRFKDIKGHVVLKNDVPLATINQRGPIVAEGRAIFRFTRNAELFANELVVEGVTCRIQPHNWGTAVAAKVTLESATAAFRVLTEKKKKSLKDACWEGYEAIGFKKGKGGKEVPNCVPMNENIRDSNGLNYNSDRHQKANMRTNRGTKVVLYPQQQLTPTRRFVELITWQFDRGYVTPLRNSRSQLSWYISRELPKLYRPSPDDFINVDMRSVVGPFSTKRDALEALNLN